MNQNQLHTPGPWSSKDSCVLFPNGAGGFNISNCQNAEANARLIAAAPELLDAIVSMRDTLKRNGYATDKADAAIAKATGANHE